MLPPGEQTAAANLSRTAVKFVKWVRPSALASRAARRSGRPRDNRRGGDMMQPIMGDKIPDLDVRTGARAPPRASGEVVSLRSVASSGRAVDR